MSELQFLVERFLKARDVCLETMRDHEAHVHQGEPCVHERTHLVGYLCHVLGIRGLALLDVSGLVMNYDVHCKAPGCTSRSVPPRPRIVCLCGSVRFYKQFQQQSLAETLAGRIVLSIGAMSGTDEHHFGHLSRAEYALVKARLDELHLRKIDQADEILVLNVGGYVGESTTREIAYARAHAKQVRFLEPDTIGGVSHEDESCPGA